MRRDDSWGLKYYMLMEKKLEMTISKLSDPKGDEINGKIQGTCKNWQRENISIVGIRKKSFKGRHTGNT